MNISITNNCNQNEVNFIRQKIIEYNKNKIGIDPIIEHIRFILKNENEEIVGGITGIRYMDHVAIDLLWVSEKLRGLGFGEKLLNQVEDIAKLRQCKMILVDTYGFQAPDFYQKYGYQIYGVLENCPVQEVKRYYFRKDL